MKRSQVGFIVCRKVDDEAAVVKRCKDQFNDKSEVVKRGQNYYQIVLAPLFPRQKLDRFA